MAPNKSSKTNKISFLRQLGLKKKCFQKAKEASKKCKNCKNENLIQSLQSENKLLKQKLTKLDQENQHLLAMLAEKRISLDDKTAEREELEFVPMMITPVTRLQCRQVGCKSGPFENEKNARRHERQTHGQWDGERGIWFITKLKCKTCGVKSKTNNSYKKHQKKKHPSENHPNFERVPDEVGSPNYMDFV